MSSPDLEETVARLDRLVAEAEAHEDPRIREWVSGMVESLARLHGEGLRRLTALLAGHGALLREALEDPVVANLLLLHDATVGEEGRSVVEVMDRRSGREEGEASSSLRVRMDDGATASFVPLEKVRRLDRKLRNGSAVSRERAAGVQEPGTGSREQAAASPPASGRSTRKSTSGRRVAAGPPAEVKPGSLRGILEDGAAILLARVGDSLRAYRNACPGSILPLHLGAREGDEVRCPWHGCRFDLDDGSPVEGEGPGLDPLPVEVEGDRVWVEVG